VVTRTLPALAKAPRKILTRDNPWADEEEPGGSDH
jgi:hypothetical protein